MLCDLKISRSIFFINLVQHSCYQFYIFSDCDLIRVELFINNIYFSCSTNNVQSGETPTTPEWILQFLLSFHLLSLSTTVDTQQCFKRICCSLNYHFCSQPCIINQIQEGMKFYVLVEDPLLIINMHSFFPLDV